MLALLCAACHEDLASTDNAFYSWDHRHVHCAVDLDTSARNDLPSIESGLDRARDRGEVLELYAHQPGHTVPWSTIESVLAGARDRGLQFLTFADLAGDTPPTAGLVLSFDDAFVVDWYAGRDLYQRYGARITFFVAYYDQLSVTEKAELAELAAEGHDIEAHSVRHQRAPTYVEDHGLAAYMADEVQPSIDRLRADGYPVTTFAYPFGARTGETDRAILGVVPQIRSVSFPWSGVSDPCPY